MVKNKMRIIHTIICVGLLSLIWIGFFLCMRYLERKIVVVDDDFSWVYQVDEIEEKNGEFVIKGFAFELNKDAVGDNYEIILQEIETGKNYYLTMDYVERIDVNNYFLCEYDYLKSGFEARIKRKKFDLYEKNYEVLLRMLGEEKTYRTDIYIVAGQIAYANPQEFVSLDVEGTDLEEIIKNGTLRVYRPDFGMYVYQYRGELYWIAESNYEFVNGDTYVQYQLETTQIEKLPMARLENEWYWDNIGFTFSAYENMDLVSGKYRVAKRSIPTNYSIKRIWTGNYIDGWRWRQDFRPYYDFD